MELHDATTSATLFGTLLSEAATLSPTRPAIDDSIRGTVTFGQLLGSASALAERLAALGAKPGSLVCVEAGEDEVATLEGIYGAALTGAPVMVLDMRWPQLRRLACLETARPSVITRDGEAAACPQHGDDAMRAASNNIGYVAFTSGSSSGRPKAVAIAEDSIANLIYEQRRVYGLGDSDRVLRWPSWSFDAAWFDLTVALGSRACLVSASRGERAPGSSLTHTLASKAISMVTLTPSALALTSPPPHRAALRTLISAGETLRESVAARWLNGGPWRLYNAYGPAEATIWTTYKHVRALRDARSVGIPIRNVRVEIRDEEGHQVPPGEDGDVWITGTSVCLGYLEGPQLRYTSAREPAQRNHRTGDIGHLDSSGELRLRGRRDRQVKVLGVRVELDEVDAHLADLDGVQDCATVLVGSGADAYLCSFIVAEPDSQPDTRGHLQARLPGTAVPRQLYLVKELPRTNNGKVDHRALIEDAQMRSRQRQDPHREPAQDAVKQPAIKVLTGIWREVLGLDEVDEDDDLFEIGCNSMGATRIVTRMASLGVADISIDELFEARTIRRVCDLLDGRPNA